MKINYELGAKPTPFTLLKGELEYNPTNKILFTHGDYQDILKVFDISEVVKVTDLTRILSQKDDIPASANLDTYNVTGLYHQNSNTNATSGSNYPVDLAGMLEVINDGNMIYQKYTRYSTPNDVYVRVSYSGTFSPWSKQWNSNNDGSGSGLDADTLDGIQGANFLRSDTNDTMAGVLTLSPTGSTTGTLAIRKANDASYSGIRWFSDERSEEYLQYTANNQAGDMTFRSKTDASAYKYIWKVTRATGVMNFTIPPTIGGTTVALVGDSLPYTKAGSLWPYSHKQETDGSLKLGYYYNGAWRNTLNLTGSSLSYYDDFGTSRTVAQCGSGVENYGFHMGTGYGYFDDYDTQTDGWSIYVRDGVMNVASKGTYYTPVLEMGAGQLKAAKSYIQYTFQIESVATSGSAANCYISSTGFFYKSTSIRANKENIKPMDGGLDMAMKLKPSTFNPKVTHNEEEKNVEEMTRLTIGLIAEEVEEVTPSLVGYDKDKKLESVQYDRIGVIAISAIHELKAEINELKAELEKVKNGCICNK